ncbi:MAG TPA: hypothetical protein PLP66_08755 [Phycisphaerae bacterium]|nr:hypothetical protein [Phycisphaerae bacterium]
MPLQWFAGFEAGDLGEVITYSGGIAVSAAAKRNGNYGCRITVPSGMVVTYITLANGYDNNGNPATISRTAYTVGFGLRVLALPQTLKSWEYLLLIAANTTHRASLRLGQTGNIQLCLGSGVSPPVATWGPLTLNRWYFCELAVLIDRYTWRMDGQVVAQGLGSPGGSMNSAHLGKRINLASQGYTVDVDDIYTCDDATLFGPTARVARLNANGDGTASGWYPPPPEELEPGGAIGVG